MSKDDDSKMEGVADIGSISDTLSGVMKPPVTRRKNIRKKGVKRRPRRKKKPGRYYFTQDTHDAIIEFQRTEDPRERDRIFEKRIYPAFKELVETLQHVYKFRSQTSQRELTNDCIVHLYHAISKFDAEKATKAFSYFNVVAKRYLIVATKPTQTVYVDVDVLNRIRPKTDPQRNSTLSSHVTYDIEETIIDTEVREMQYDVLLDIKRELDEIAAENPTPSNLMDTQCIDTLIYFYETSHDLPSYGKRALCTYIREITGATTKQLSASLSRIRQMYAERMRNM